MLRNLAAFLVLLPIMASGSTITFFGPDDSNGNPCVAGTPHCVLGDPSIYEVFSVQITKPVTPGGLWTLTIETDYGVPLPGSPDVIPDYKFEGVYFSISDFLITWKGVDYGIVLHPHDGYSAGDIYSASSFQDSEDVMGPFVPDVLRPNLPVLLGTGGTLLGLGSLSASVNAGSDGITSAMYTIVDQFQAPPNFLTGETFTVYDSSYVCANGYITGTGQFDAVPEPSTLILVGLSLAAIGRARVRNS